MKNLFPIAPQALPKREALPVCRDGAWDFVRDRPVFAAGEPVMVEGAQAVAVWCYHALRAARYRNPARSFGYGCELERLVGRPYSEDVKRAEAARYITEALEVSPYVEGVSVEDLKFEGSTLSGTVRVRTVYGEVSVDV